ncbi:hypothetical protein AUP68_01272 [Ilyonectria robusta]
MPGDLPSGVIQLSNGNGPAHQPQGPPMQQPNNRGPAGMPLNMQNQHMQPQNQPMMHIGPPPSFPPPPQHAVPHDLRPRNTVEISDIRSERFTEADARERLSSYVVIRLEKTDNAYDVDEEGFPLTPTWEKVRQITQTDLSQQEIKRQVRVLERETKPLTEKKAACSLAIQRQLELTQEKLSQTDPDKRFCYKLVQFESKLRKLEERELQYIEKYNKGSKKEKKSSKKYVSTHLKKGKSKPKYERVSITAYFKRTPTPEQSGLRLLEEREQRMRMPPPPQQMPVSFPPVMHPAGGPANLPMHPANPGPPVNPGPPINSMPPPNTGPPAGVQKGPPPPNNQPKQAPPPNNPPKPPTQGKPDNAGKRGKEGKEGKDNNQPRPMTPNVQVITVGKTMKVHRGSPRSSDGSLASEDSYSSSSTGSTPQSSLGSAPNSQKRGRGRSRTPVQRIKLPEHFGVVLPRQHSQHEKNYILDRYPPAIAVAEQVPFPSPQFSSVDMAPHRQDRRHILHDDELFRQDRRPIRPILRDDEPSYKRRTTLLPPRIHQQRPSVRRVSPSEARHEVLQDGLERVESRLERLRLDAAYRDEEFRRDDERFDRLAQEPQRRVVLPNRFRDTFAEDQNPRERESRWPERDAHEYMRQREPAFVREAHPFQPLGRREIHRGY